ncbi:GNAT family N-acetyltransferase [Flavimaricola sp.]|nr:GNAT family N-acetyltransferase [Flavimaricola sp.]MDA9019808.1 GNAT family N-acetyltransferase [Flavimaricola sp.]
MTAIPTLTTARLVLRPPVAADFDTYAPMMASERARFMGGPFDRKTAWGMFCHDTAGWSLFGIGSLKIVDQASGTLLGQVGINHGPLFPEPELGWMLYDGQEGKGYATEAAGALRDWAFATTQLASLVSYVDAGNIASQKVAERLGGKLDPAAERHDPQDLVYRHLRGRE